MNHQARAQFRLKPSGLGRHDVAGVGDVDDLLHAHRIERESDLHLTAVHTTFQLAEATDTANEVDALVGAEVLDAQNLVEDKVAEDGDVQHADGIVVVVGAGLGSQAVPHALDVHREIVELVGLVLGVALAVAGELAVALAAVLGAVALALDVEVLLQSLEEVLGAEAVEVFHDAVVVDDVQLVVGEDDGHKVVVLFLAGVGRILLFLLLTDEGCGGTTVVTVSDVHGRNLLVEQLDEAGDGGLVVDDPEAMAEAVFLGDEVIDGLLGGDLAHDGVDFGDGRVGKEHRLHIGVGEADVLHAVFLFVLAGQFVLLDDFVHIVFAVGAGHDAILPVGVGVGGVHALGIDVELFLFILLDPSEVFETIEVLNDFQIGFEVAVLVAFGQVDFGLGHVEQAVGVAFTFLAGFFGVQNVVRAGGQFLDDVHAGTPSFERFDD